MDVRRGFLYVFSSYFYLIFSHTLRREPIRFAMRRKGTLFLWIFGSPFRHGGFDSHFLLTIEWFGANNKLWLSTTATPSLKWVCSEHWLRFVWNPTIYTVKVSNLIWFTGWVTVLSLITSTTLLERNSLLVWFPRSSPFSHNFPEEVVYNFEI